MSEDGYTATDSRAMCSGNSGTKIGLCICYVNFPVTDNVSHCPFIHMPVLFEG